VQSFPCVLQLFGDRLCRLPGLLEDFLCLLLLRVRKIERLHHAVAGYLPPCASGRNRRLRDCQPRGYRRD
jgi:hypothetical protein